MTQKDEITHSYQHCKKIALGHYENFPVGSLLIPKAHRPAIWAIYAFARIADDFADEGYPLRSHFETDEKWIAAIEAQKTERLAKLAEWRRQLKNCYPAPLPHPLPQGERGNLIFIALQDAIQRYQIPYELLNDLLIAFERDVTERRKENWDAVLDYCRYSANPVGRLVLWVFGYRDEKLFELSDAICTGLQLANFWQDIAVDAEKDRVYVPVDMGSLFVIPAKAGIQLDPLDPCIRKDDTVSLLHKLGQLTWPFFEKGFELPLLVKGRLAWELKLTWLGGVKILEKACANPHRLSFERPKIETKDKIDLALKSVFAYNERTLKRFRTTFTLSLLTKDRGKSVTNDFTQHPQF